MRAVSGNAGCFSLFFLAHFLNAILHIFPELPAPVRCPDMVLKPDVRATSWTVLRFVSIHRPYGSPPQQKYGCKIAPMDRKGKKRWRMQKRISFKDQS